MLLVESHLFSLIILKLYEKICYYKSKYIILGRNGNISIDIIIIFEYIQPKILNHKYETRTLH